MRYVYLALWLGLTLIAPVLIFINSLAPIPRLHAFYQRAKVTEGTVVAEETRKGRGRSPSTYYETHVRYSVPGDGRTFDQIFVTTRGPFAGKPVTVWYDPGDPGNCEIKPWEAVRANAKRAAILFGVLMILPVAVSFIILRR